MSDKSIHQNLNISLPASVMTRNYVKLIKQKFMLTEILKVN